MPVEDLLIDGAALLFLVVWCFLVAPGRLARERRAPFIGRMYAHRGLYAADQSVPENSLLAFLNAADAGYGIELDVQRTRDGQIVIFHDESMLRVCGVDKHIRDYSYAELAAFPLFVGEHRIPLFSDALTAVAGRVPLIVELKYGPDWIPLCEETLRLLRAAGGAYCVESFHPRIVRWFRRNAPDIVRGQLSEAYRFSSKSLPCAQSLMMSRLLTNFLTRPQFIAYRIGPMGLSARLAEMLGAMRVRWTARPDTDLSRLGKTADAIIFEHFQPARTFDARAK